VDSKALAPPTLRSADLDDAFNEPPKGMPGPSVKLALIVVALAVFIVILGLIALAFTGTKPVAAPTSIKTAKGSPLAAIPAATDLAPMISGGEPPDDIVNAIALPKGSIPGATYNNTQAAQGYDEQRLFTVDTSQQNVISFFEAELPSLGWHLQSKGPARNQNGYEVLAQRAGSDANYWQIGAVVSPTTFPTSGAGAKSGVTQFEIRLFQISDSE